MKKILLSLVAGSFIFAYQPKDVSNITVYGGGINYSDKSAKDNAYIGGIYFSQSFFETGTPFSVEADGERTVIKYKDKSYYAQDDLTLKMNFYYLNNYMLSFGGHKIFINNYKGNYPWCVFGNIKYYQTGLYNFGMGVYYSNYDNSSYKFRVAQFSPYVGMFITKSDAYFTNYLGSLYIEGKIDYQKFERQKDPFAKDSYMSGEFKLINYHRNFNLTFEAELGENTYKVLNDGFVVRNLDERVKSSYSISLNVYTPLNFTIKYQHTEKEDTSLNSFSEDLMLGFLNFYF